MAGIVVRHKETGNTYAVSEENRNPDTEEKIRDLKPGESIRSFVHKPKETLKSDKPQAIKPATTPKENK